MKLITENETFLISGGDYDESSLPFFCESGLIISDLCEKDIVEGVDFSLN